MTSCQAQINRNHHKILFNCLKAPGKSLGVSVPGIGHSDIRGLVTYRSMVRRERYRLTSWITLLCHHRFLVDRSNLETPKLLQDAFRCKYGCFAALDYPLSQRAGNVKAGAASAVRSSLDITWTLRYLTQYCRSSYPR